jgi:Ca2+-binding RTX toxin-like protein
MHGDADQDEMYGQLGDDFMAGDDGDDAMVGDLGLITTTIEDGSREQVITIPAPFFEETIYGIGTLTRRTLLYSDQQGDGAEGNDTMLGGAGDDNLHGVAGNDFMNGNGDNDHLFGGDGDDAAWGGTGNDHLYGGYHDDHLDVVPREAREVGHGNNTTLFPADPPEWFTYGPALDSFQDIDIIYGGWDQDALQADVGGPGPVPGDRLVDWAGGYNVYYVCPPAYGEGLITRMLNPALIAFLQQLSEADGAVDTATSGTTGFRELAMVFPSEIRFNSHPPHPDHPGHFTCVEP